MAAEEPSRAHCRLEALEKREPVLSELLPRPARRLEQTSEVLLVLDRLGTDVERQEEAVRVAEHARTVELAQELDALERLRSSLRDVAERDDQVRPAVLQIGERSPESDGVAVHVGEESDAHSAQLMAAP